MNPFEIFNNEEIIKVNSCVGRLENKEYTKEEWRMLENSVLEDIMSRSSKNGDIVRANNEFKNILNKISRYTM